MASGRGRFHADWLGVGRKELCRRVVSRQPVRGGRFRACAHNPSRSPFQPLWPSPADPTGSLLFAFFIGRRAGSRDLHNGEPRATTDYALDLSKRFNNSARFARFRSFARTRRHSAWFVRSRGWFTRRLQHRFSSGSRRTSRRGRGRRGKVHFGVQSVFVDGAEKCTQGVDER